MTTGLILLMVMVDLFFTVDHLNILFVIFQVCLANSIALLLFLTINIRHSIVSLFILFRNFFFKLKIKSHKFREKYDDFGWGPPPPPSSSVSQPASKSDWESKRTSGISFGFYHSLFWWCSSNLIEKESERNETKWNEKIWCIPQFLPIRLNSIIIEIIFLFHCSPIYEWFVFGGTNNQSSSLLICHVRWWLQVHIHTHTHTHKNQSTRALIFS